MKQIVGCLLAMSLLAGCVSNQDRPVPTEETVLHPPLPPGYVPPVSRAAVTASMPALQSAEIMSIPLVPPTPPGVARMTSMRLIDNLVRVEFDLAVYGFGIVYSDDLRTWNLLGEARWTNTVPHNPFLEPGITEHRVWVQENQWSVVHTPGPEIKWSLVLTDLEPRVSRFYWIYPTYPIEGLP